MEKVIIYSESMELRGIESALAGYPVERVGSVKALVEALVEEPATAAVLVQSSRGDEAFAKLLSSVRHTFPKLNIFVFSGPAAPEFRVEGCRYFDSQSAEDAGREVKTLLSAAAGGTEQRKYNRFGWPLKAAVKNEGGEWESYRLHSLGAGGAFFAFPRQVPPPGSIRETVIEFQNCRLHTKAEILDTRRNSSNLPFGFGVRFIGLDPESAAVIDRIVQNALVKHLLEPDTKAEIPSIGEEELTPQFDLS